MLHEFLETNRSELIARCRTKVARRPAPSPTPKEMEHGIPLFLGQLIRSLRLELGDGDPTASTPARGDRGALRIVHSDMAAGATRHGDELLREGFTVEQVVHDYGDLCQAITELASERNAGVSVHEFHTLNRCLDNAIADAVGEFGRQRDDVTASTGQRAMNERLGFVAHEMRNHLNTAMLSFDVIRNGKVAANGATSAVVERSHAALRDLIERALVDVRLSVALPAALERVALDRFFAEVRAGASLEARARDCALTVAELEPGLAVRADRAMLHSAISNLLQNAFKFTHPHGTVSLRGHATGGRILIEVADECGGLPAGKAEAMFVPFEQFGADRSGLGLGLSIARRAIEASGGRLGVRNVPGTGCVFTADLLQEA